MTDALRLLGGLLTASAESNRLTFMLLPFGEPGSTNKGQVTASKGSLTLPADPSTLHANFEHDAKRPLGKAVALEETDAGIIASFDALDTTAGRDWITEARAGVRTGISVEIGSPVIRAGKLLAGELTGAGAVVKPAFPSAQMVAADAGTDPVTALTGHLSDAAAAIGAAQDAIAQSQNPPATTPVTASHVKEPASMKLPVPPLFATSTETKDNDTEFSAGALYAALAGRGEDPALLAAFSTVQKSKNFDIYNQPAYVGEINAQKPYKRRYADLIRNTPLTSMNVNGWKFKTTPIVDDYAGNFAEIASNTVEIVAVTETAGRVAGGNKVDRIHHDFPDAGFWAGYLRESAADYDRKTDRKVLNNLTSTATKILAGPSFSSAPRGWSKLVDGVLNIWEDYQQDFALIGSDLYREMLLTSDKDKLAFLNASLGWEEGQVNNFQFRPISTPGAVIVGSKDSAELQELPGLIRVSALDVAHAASDEGCYGYNGTWTRDARALVSVVDELPAP